MPRAFNCPTHGPNPPFRLRTNGTRDGKQCWKKVCTLCSPANVKRRGGQAADGSCRNCGGRRWATRPHKHAKKGVQNRCLDCEARWAIAAYRRTPDAHRATAHKWRRWTREQPSKFVDLRHDDLSDEHTENAFALADAIGRDLRGPARPARAGSNEWSPAILGVKP